MIPPNTPYGTIIRSTREGTNRKLTLMFIGAAEMSAHVLALLLDADRQTMAQARRLKGAWHLGRASRIDVSDLWRFEVVE